MSDPAGALQRAVFAALTGDAAVTALVERRVFDRVEPDAAYPYIRIGEDQVVSDRADGLARAVEVYLTLHVWSGDVGKMQAKAVANAIVDVLDDADLDLGTGLRLVLLEHHDTRLLDGETPLVTHAVVTLRAFVDPA